MDIKMSRFSFINLLNEGDTSDDFHKEHKLRTEHTSFKHRRIAESEIVKPKSRFTFADFLKSQNAEPTEEIDNTDYNEIDDLVHTEDELDDVKKPTDLDDNEIDDLVHTEDELDNSNDVDNAEVETKVEVLKSQNAEPTEEIDNTDYNEIDDLVHTEDELDDVKKPTNLDDNEIDDLDDTEDDLDNSNDVDNAEVETKVEVLKPVEIGQEKSIQADLLNNYAKIDDLDKIKLNIKIVDPKTNEETELNTPNVLDKLDKPLTVKVIEPEEKPKQEVDIEIAKPEETNVEVKSSDDVTLETSQPPTA